MHACMHACSCADVALTPCTQSGGLRLLDEAWTACAAAAPLSNLSVPTPWGLSPGAPCADAFAHSTDRYIAGTRGILELAVAGNDFADVYDLQVGAMR